MYFISAAFASTIKLPDCRPGFIEYVRFEDEFDNLLLYSKILVIKLDSYDHEHYTRREHLFPFLIDAQTRRDNVTLHTNSCNSGDHGFASFTLKPSE